MRDERIDVARGLLIAGVVVGHLIERSSDWEGGVQRLALTGLYAMHMPAFVFLTGLLAKPGELVRKTLGLASVLIVFQSIYITFLTATGHPLKEWYWPYWVLWYVMALIVWQFLVPAIRRWPVQMFTLSCVGVLLIGLAQWHGNWFAYQRVFTFAPFFVAGCAWGRKILDFARSCHIVIKILALLSFAGAVLVLYLRNPNPHWLFQNWTFEQLGVEPLNGMLLRSIVTLVGALGTFAFLALMPSRARSAIWLGERTLAIFIGHVFAVLAFDWWIVPHLVSLPGSVVLAANIALGIGLSYLFTWRPLVVLTNGVRRLPDELLRTPDPSKPQRQAS